MVFRGRVQDTLLSGIYHFQFKSDNIEKSVNWYYPRDFVFYTTLLFFFFIYNSLQYNEKWIKIY